MGGVLGRSGGYSSRLDLTETTSSSGNVSVTKPYAGGAVERSTLNDATAGSSGIDTTFDRGRAIYRLDLLGRIVDVEGRPVPVDPETGIPTDNTGVVDGFQVGSVRTYTSGPKAGITTIQSTQTPLGIEFSTAGSILGNLLGKSIAGDNRLARAASSAFFKTVAFTVTRLR